MTKQFQLVDVFGGESFKGNPVAVISGADALSKEDMLDITRWMNLSETTFLLPPTDPGADYRVRIFTPQRELPFAGHPTLGTCHAWLAAGGKPKGARIVQQCGAGLINVRKVEGGFGFAAPPLVRSGPVSEQDLARALEVLRIDRSAVVEAQWVDNGAGWVFFWSQRRPYSRFGHWDLIRSASILGWLARILLEAPSVGRCAPSSAIIRVR